MAGDDPPEIGRDPPAEPPTMEAALTQIGQETRARILLELGAASDGPTDLDGLGYAELMDRVGAEDSGRFNYHLSKLVGGLVEKTDDGYWLRVNGHLVYQALVAGTLTGDAATPSFDTGAACEDCGADLRAEYATDQIFFVRCEECERVYQHLEFPARGVEDRSGRAALDAAVRYFNGQFAGLRRGVCPACAGRVDADLLAPDDADILAELLPDAAGFATLACESCSLERIGTPDLVALTTPPAVGFFDWHGVNPYAVSVPELDEYVVAVDVNENAPVSATVTFELDGERLRVTLDDSLAVADATTT